MNSVAETELLMQLAALLMPEDAPIEEMFRNFPAPGGVGWATTWSQISVCVESLKMRMLHYLWNMMDIGGMRERKEWRKI